MIEHLEDPEPSALYGENMVADEGDKIVEGTTSRGKRKKGKRSATKKKGGARKK